MTEHWWDIPLHTKTEYQASTTGLIRNKNTGELVSASLRNGYISVSLDRVRHNVHRLVALTFLGKPKPGMQAAHGDGNKQNNNLTNLRWATPKENHGDKKAHGTSPSGTRNPRAKLSESEVRIIRERLAAGEKSGRLAKEFGVSRSTVQFIKFGQTWKEMT